MACVRAVDEHTPDTPESRGGLWGLLLCSARVNMGVLLGSEGLRELLGEAPGFVVALLGVQIDGWVQASEVAPGGEAGAGGGREMEGERLGREYALGAAYEDGNEVPAAWPMD